jgi:hypothetical protein
MSQRSHHTLLALALKATQACTLTHHGKRRAREALAKLAALTTLVALIGCGEEPAELNTSGGAEAGLPSYGPGVRNHCRSNPASGANALCASVLLPDDLPGAPVQVSFHFFAELPPSGPPTRFGVELKDAASLAEFRPGYEVPLYLTNAPSSGVFYPYVVLYFEGGGATSWIPVSAIDYVAQQDGGPLTFTGEAVNLEEPLVAVRVP